MPMGRVASHGLIATEPTLVDGIARGLRQRFSPGTPAVGCRETRQPIREALVSADAAEHEPGTGADDAEHTGERRQPIAGERSAITRVDGERDSRDAEDRR